MRALTILLASALFTVATSASATDDPEKLFSEGNALMEQGKITEALAKFEEAQKIDPGVGTLFNIAACHERLGHLATAYRNFGEVARFAHAAGKKQREDAAQQKLAEIKPRLSYFVISSTDPGDVLVRVDGAIVPKDAWSFVPLDSGDHRVEASAPTKRSWSSTVAASAEGQKTEVVIPLLQAVEGKTVTVTKETTNTKRTVGYAVGGVGLVGLAAAGVTGFMILDAKSNADKHCTGGPNGNQCIDATGAQDSQGVNAVNSGKTLGPINAVAWGVGAVGVGVGAFLILTSGKKQEAPAPKSALTPSFTPLPGGGFVGLAGVL